MHNASLLDIIVYIPWFFTLGNPITGAVIFYSSIISFIVNIFLILRLRRQNNDNK